MDNRPPQFFAEQVCMDSKMHGANGQCLQMRRARIFTLQNKFFFRDLLATEVLQRGEKLSCVQKQSWSYKVVHHFEVPRKGSLNVGKRFIPIEPWINTSLRNVWCYHLRQSVWNQRALCLETQYYSWSQKNSNWNILMNHGKLFTICQNTACIVVHVPQLNENICKSLCIEYSYKNGQNFCYVLLLQSIGDNQCMHRSKSVEHERLGFYTRGTSKMNSKNSATRIFFLFLHISCNILSSLSKMSTTGSFTKVAPSLKYTKQQMARRGPKTRKKCRRSTWLGLWLAKNLAASQWTERTGMGCATRGNPERLWKMFVFCDQGLRICFMNSTVTSGVCGKLVSAAVDATCPALGQAP